MSGLAPPASPFIAPTATYCDHRARGRGDRLRPSGMEALVACVRRRDGAARPARRLPGLPVLVRAWASGGTTSPSPGRSTSSATIGGWASPAAGCSPRRCCCCSETEWRGALNRITETVSLLAACAGAVYPIIHLGRPWFFYWNLPYPNTLATVAAVPQPAVLGCGGHHQLSRDRAQLLVHRPAAGSGLAARPGVRARAGGGRARDAARADLRRARARLARLGVALAALDPGLPHHRAAGRAGGGGAAERGGRDVRGHAGAGLARHAAAGLRSCAEPCSRAWAWSRRWRC